MGVVLIVGVLLFFVGLVMSHVVVAVTRGSIKRGEPMKKSHRMMMWGSVAIVVIGFILAAVGFIFRGEAT